MPATTSPEMEVERYVGRRYRLLEPVGVGGMATVYRAWDERLKRKVAVKVIAEWLVRDPVAVRRFRREAQLSAGLSHPNIVAILDAGSDPREHIVMELVKGLHAGTVLQGRGVLTTGQVIHVVSQICDALAYAHGRNVVHHDVSPRNILIGQPESRAKLADFGLASGALDAPAGRSTSIMGTPGYVAPEVLGGASPSPHADLYSLGMVTCRLLAGRPGMQPLEEARPDLPRGLTEAVHRALARDPRARQDSVAEFGAQLVDGETVPLRLAA